MRSARLRAAVVAWAVDHIGDALQLGYDRLEPNAEGHRVAIPVRIQRNFPTVIDINIREIPEAIERGLKARQVAYARQKQDGRYLRHELICPQCSCNDTFGHRAMIAVELRLDNALVHLERKQRIVSSKKQWKVRGLARNPYLIVHVTLRERNALPLRVNGVPTRRSQNR